MFPTFIRKSVAIDMPEEIIWNPWHGCVKFSEGCKNCYVYRRDESIGKDASHVEKTQNFDLPVRRKKDGQYKIPAGSTVYACMTSDFFLDKADCWRQEMWHIIKQRSDVSFIIITKRIARFEDCLPGDWGNGYENVSVCCTVENQKECEIRMPIFVKLPIKRRLVICEPLLSRINFGDMLQNGIQKVIVGGESGEQARPCRYEWVLEIREQCRCAGVPFSFKQTGAHFVKDGVHYTVPRSMQHLQAKKAGIDIDFSM